MQLTLAGGCASNMSDKPRLIVVAGPNGSGKTSITEKILAHQWFEGCHYINPDVIAQKEFGDWNSPEATLKAAIHAEELRFTLLQQHQSIAFETVLSATDKVDFIQRAKDEGYFVRLFFVGTSDPSINAARVARRVMEGGHDVPIPKIISRYNKSIANCIEVAAISDRAYIYDNSIDFADPALLYRLRDGELFRRYADPEKLPPWAAGVLDAIADIAKDSPEEGEDRTPAPRRS